tara:strand:- start:17176 stop:20580 length:3405 start_codon:yes stop_codon:yes gene_type:complete
MQHLFDMRPDRPGYRLQKLEVFNWGTFDSSDGNVFCFEPQGRTALLVGHNGSGKSTLVDAILTLLVDGKTRNYNVAAGARKTERTAKSYIKGAYDRTTDELQGNVIRYLRPKGNMLTAISAVFKDEQLDRSFTLTQILYLKSDGSDDRVFAFSTAVHELKADLQGLQKSDEVREHLKQCGYQTTRSYAEYQRWLIKQTGMRSKAINMFNQTVAVKDIQSLNTFIRSHMLEAANWQDKIQGLLKHFDDLSNAHHELVRAQRAQELLVPVASIGKKYRLKAEKLDQLQFLYTASQSCFPVLKLQVVEPELELLEKKEVAQKTILERLTLDLEQTRETVRNLKNDIDQAGGERLRRIPELIDNERVFLKTKTPHFHHYHNSLKQCGVIEEVWDRDQFQQAEAKLRELLSTNLPKLGALKDQHETAIGEKSAVENQLNEERVELEALQQQRSNLPPRFTTIRSRLCTDLNLNESELPYAAELIAVEPDQRSWTAAIEMVLRPFALSLLVPERYYTRVRAYIEKQKLTDARGAGLRLDYLCIGNVAVGSGDRIPASSLYHKLQLKPKHPLTPWVKEEIQQRYNFQCCDSVDEFDQVSRNALTANCHVKFNRKRHQKDDRDRTTDPRFFVLGWNNAEKKKYVLRHIQELNAEYEVLQNKMNSLEDQLEELQSISQAAEFVLKITDFDQIDIARHQAAIDALVAEKKKLETSNNTVQVLKNQLEQVKEQEHTLSVERDEKLGQQAKLDDNILRVKTLLKNTHADIKKQHENGNYQKHEKYFPEIADSIKADTLAIDNLERRMQDWKETTQQTIDKLREPFDRIKEKLIEAMSKYLREFKEEADDIDARIESLESFLGLLEQVHEEDLPRYERQFKDKLNDQVSQEIALFNTELRTEQKQIEEKIHQLNSALKKVNYSPATYMRLKPSHVNDREIEDFKRSLRECLDESLEQTPEANEVRFLRIQSLVQRLSDKEMSSWRKKVIDVRNWYNFVAEEIVFESGETRSSYDGSSGQSGGEKAKLAFTILVAALAYQLDIDPDGNTPGRFQFVVVDEMFSKVDDQNAEYALKLFDQFGLQLLIVAPLDAKARVTEPFVDRYLSVVKDAVTSRSKLLSMTAQQYQNEVQKDSPKSRSRSRNSPSSK